MFPVISYNFLQFSSQKIQPPSHYCNIITIYRYHNLYNQTFVSNKFFILYTRDASFPAVKKPKEDSLKVFNKYIKSYFSNVEDGRSPDRKTSVSVFYRKTYSGCFLKKYSHWVCKKRNRAVLGKCSRWNLNFQISSVRWNALCLRLSEPTAWLTA